MEGERGASRAEKQLGPHQEREDNNRCIHQAGWGGGRKENRAGYYVSLHSHQGDKEWLNVY